MQLEHIRYFGRVHPHPSFVFACWVSNTHLENKFISSFNDALKFGINNIDNLISDLKKETDFYSQTENYLKHQISYHLDSEKKKGMNLFLEYLKK